MKDISKMINEFEELPYKVNGHKRPKHEPTDSYFYIAIHIDKCMIIADDFNLHVETVRKETTGT